MKTIITKITITEASDFSLKTTLIELSDCPTPDQMDKLFSDETVVLCF